MFEPATAFLTCNALLNPSKHLPCWSPYPLLLCSPSSLNLFCTPYFPHCLCVLRSLCIPGVKQQREWVARPGMECGDGGRRGLWDLREQWSAPCNIRHDGAMESGFGQWRRGHCGAGTVPAAAPASHFLFQRLPVCSQEPHPFRQSHYH